MARQDSVDTPSVGVRAARQPASRSQQRSAIAGEVAGVGELVGRMRDRVEQHPHLTQSEKSTFDRKLRQMNGECREITNMINEQTQAEGKSER